MAQASGTAGRSKNLVLTAMIFAVSMTFIDQTIVSIAVPEIQRELGLTSTGVQWAVNAYLLSLAALFALGGRLADTIGPRRMVTIGVIMFAGASTLCGLTPKGSLAEAWIIVFRVIQGAGGAIMFPAALAIVVQTFPLRERGKALAAFFGIAGGLTALGPLLGGFLTEWTWRAIFWVNIPVAIVALILIAWSKPVSAHQPARLDYRGAVLIAAGIALSVLGFQQSQVWGWTNPATGLCIAAGLVLLVVFYFVEVRTPSPLMQMSMFRIRPFLVENLVLGVAMLAFVPVFFFASLYAQVALAESSSQASLYLLYFFIGFVVASQIGGRMLDRIGAKRLRRRLTQRVLRHGDLHGGGRDRGPGRPAQWPAGGTRRPARRAGKCRPGRGRGWRGHGAAGPGVLTRSVASGPGSQQAAMTAAANSAGLSSGVK